MSVNITCQPEFDMNTMGVSGNSGWISPTSGRGESVTDDNGLCREEIVIFDGMCHLCSRSVSFIIRNDPGRRFRFVALQSEAGQILVTRLRDLEAPEREKGSFTDPSGADSVILFRQGRLFFFSEAALRIAGDLRFPWNLLKGFLWIPRPVRDGIYRFIAGRRFQWFGRRESCRMANSGETGRFLTPEEVRKMR